MEVIIILALIAGGYGYYQYIVMKSQIASVEDALEPIEFNVKKCKDMVPNLLEIIKDDVDSTSVAVVGGKRVFTDMDTKFDKNNPHSVKVFFESGESLYQAMCKLIALVEENIVLTEDKTVKKYCDMHYEVTRGLAAARRTYNTEAAALNQAILVFPGSVVITFFNPRPQQMPLFAMDSNFNEKKEIA